MSLADELTKLEGLRQSGALSEHEFQAAKSRVLAGGQEQEPEPRERMPGDFLHRLHRSRTDVWLGGVCGGLGQYTEIPAWAWRLGYTIALFCGGIGIIPYVLMWIFIPQEKGPED